jgi:hypothetical protein
MITYILIHIACAFAACWFAIRAFGKLTLDIAVYSLLTGPIMLLVAFMFEAGGIVIYRSKK